MDIFLQVWLSSCERPLYCNQLHSNSLIFFKKNKDVVKMSWSSLKLDELNRIQNSYFLGNDEQLDSQILTLIFTTLKYQKFAFQSFPCVRTGSEHVSAHTYSMKQLINSCTGKLCMQNSSLQRQGDETHGISPSKDGEDPGLPEVPGSKKAQKKQDKDLQQLFWPMGDLLGTRCWKRCCPSRKRFVLTVPAQAWISDMHSESYWAEQEPSGVCGHTTPAVCVALPAVRIKLVHHGQLPHHSSKCLANGFGRLEPALPQLYSKIPVCAVVENDI